MDFATEAAQPSLHRAMRFEGTGSEYFRIWIVNLGLSIITLGIFSAWAKVRTRRYFLGNTVLDGHSFDYHAHPLRILLGRIIAVVLLAGYSLSVNFGGPKFVLAWMVVFLAALPWLVKTTFRFNARNTSYRNVRFQFDGSYGGAFQAYILWLFGAALSLFILTPFAHRARDYYHVNYHSFGGRRFNSEFNIGPLYAIYIATILLFLLGIGAAIALVVSGGLLNSFVGLKPGQHPQLPPGMIGLVFGALAIYLATIFLVGSFFRAKVFNLVINSTLLDGGLSLESTLPVLPLMWIVVSNLFLTVITVGLFYPFAMVRQTRFIVEHLAVTGSGNIDDVADSAAVNASAIGEEVGSFFDIDFGL
jgi:uncharacterized membrane protein YjgN (DUF898 family)